MQRTIESQLLSWKSQVNRLPLLIRGARQIGKSYVVEKFAKENFQEFLNVNFEQEPTYKQAFQTLKPVEICNALELLSKKSIQANQTLLFLDEIQECPSAIQSLRYFKEEMPNLHVIGAGSLLEFALNDDDFKMPVGRVQYYYMKPLTFYEFLIATGNEKLADYLAQVNLDTKINTAVHQLLLKLVREYLVLGGMPAVIQHYLETRNFQQCHEIQTNILTTFRNDFGKYANKSKHKYLQAIFEHAPGMVTQHFQYVNVDPHMQSRDLKEALQALCDASLIYQVFLANANGLPLNATISAKKFKLLFLDVGLVQSVSSLSSKLLLSKDLITVNRGQIVEQFVGQELLTLQKIYQPGSVYYWERSKPGSTAEIDYILQTDSHIVPIEVKAGTTGRLKSLQLFLEEKKQRLGIQISQLPLFLDKNILSIPFYLIRELPRLFDSTLRKL